MAVQTQIQTRRGTAATWTSTNPTLAAGEIGFETDTGKFKIGNGSTAWASLSYNTNGATASPLTTKGDLFTYSTTNARLAVGNNGESLVADSSTATGLRYQAPVNANPVINSAFQVWQRNISGAMGGTGTTYLADRWSMYSASAGTVSRQLTNDTTNLPNIQYCARVQRDSGQTTNGSQIIGQSFETINSIPYAGKTVTFSFYARKGANFSGASDVLTAYLRSGTGTDQNATGAGFTGSSFVITISATLTSTWQRFTGTGTVSTSATQLETEFRYTTTGTAGAADYFEVTGVQLEVGSVATPFKTNGTIQQEIAACQRYFYKTTPYLSATSSSARVFPLGVAVATTQMSVTIPFPQALRIVPTAVSYSGLRAYDGAGFITVTSMTFSDATPMFANVALNASSGFTTYRPTFPACDGSDGFMSFSAEL